MTYFTSDQHFGHFNIIRLCNRPFASVEEMDGAMLSRWNAKLNAAHAEDAKANPFDLYCAER